MTGSCPFGQCVTATAGQALICSAVQEAGRLLRRRAWTSGSRVPPPDEQPPTARTTPVAERKTVNRYRVFISAPVCQVEEGTSYGPPKQQGPRQRPGAGNPAATRPAAAP